MTSERAPRAPAGQRRPERTRARPGSDVLILLTLLAFLPVMGLIASRPRTAAAPPGEHPLQVEHEPPASPLVAPRPQAYAGPAAGAASSARRMVESPAEAGPAVSGSRPASAHLPLAARLELQVRIGQEPAGLAWIELGHTAPGAELEQVLLLQADARGELVRALGPGALRIVAWSEQATALPAFAELRAGQSTALEIALEPACPVAGRVIDARTGAPLHGAEIAFWTFAELDSVRTAADGTFRHPRFPARAPAQQVRAAAPGYGPAVRYLRIDPAGGWKLAGAAPDEPSLTGTGTPWIELALVPELVIRGRVVDEQGNPLPGARLGAEGYFHVRPAVAARDGATAVSDETGAFELSGLRSDIGHALTAEAAGRARRTLELGAAPDGPLVIALAPAAPLSGTVIDGAGIPAEDIELVLLPTTPAEAVARQGPLDAGARIQGRELRTRTDATGTFVFEGLEPGRLRLSVQRDGDPLLEHELEPLADGRFEQPLLVLPPDRVTLEGSVRDERGRLLAGARVELERRGRVAVLTTDAAGRFRCAGLDLEGPYRIRVTLGGLEANASAWANERPEIALDAAGPELARARTH